MDKVIKMCIIRDCGGNDYGIKSRLFGIYFRTIKPM